MLRSLALGMDQQQQANWGGRWEPDMTEPPEGARVALLLAPYLVVA